ncbi:N-acetylmuramoyl-L-alanine amidase [Knoellia locipacati]|uniref:N-acetylmuramoyl-L-alanine amidase n=1 Tax=Knoellia locipacati TaxID=882824 RepID=UPI00384B155C
MAEPPQRAPGPSLPRPRVVSRRGWGADESLRFTASGKEIWPRDTDPVSGLVLHHTRTPNAEEDPAARLRGVYSFHAIDRGWGDIGYHLLVDERGVVYEGRAGSAVVLDGGPVVLAGHVYGHNHGNIGIAMLGTLFEEPPSPQARGTLVGLMAWLVSVHQLDATMTQGVEGATSTTIRAHRDLWDTTCPGDAFYALLPALRAEVAQRTGSPWPSAGTDPPTIHHSLGTHRRSR